MERTAQKALTLLREVKSVTFATVNNNQPAARIIDVMIVNDNGLYFLTGPGKSFYRQLKENPCVAICGITPDYVSVRLVGDIKFIEGKEIIDKIFELNPVMNDLYPGDKRYILQGIHLYQGKGEIFDLSSEPPERQRFSYGGATVNPVGYRILENCSACGVCESVCPVGAIEEGDIFKITGSNCLECGACFEACPEDAIQAASGL